MQVIEVDEKYHGIANYLLSNVFIAENEDALQNSTDVIVLEKNGKYVKGKYFLAGGSEGYLKVKESEGLKIYRSLMSKLYRRKK